MKRIAILAAILAAAHPSCAIDLLGTVAISGRAQDVQIEGDYAYCADQYGLWVLDLSNPQQVTSLAHWGSSGLSSGVVVYQSTGYVCDGSHGLDVLDLSDPSQPSDIGLAP